MVAVAQGEALGAANPRLVFFAITSDGKMVDLASLDFEIFSKVTDEEKVVPASIATGSVNLNDAPAGQRLGPGRYALPFTVPASQKPGLYELRWSFAFTGGPTKQARIEFEVLKGTAALLGPAYAFVTDMRAEGIADSVSDARVQTSIVAASRFIEHVTSRFFEPRYSAIRMNGNGARAILLDQPICGIEEIRLETEPTLLPDLSVDDTLYRVFARHLSQGLLLPDDRESPKIEFVHTDDLLGVGDLFQPLSGISLSSLGFPVGVQNVQVKGVFGYTENVHNGSPWGDVPALIRHATKLIAARNLPKLNDPCRADAQDAWRVLSEKVMEQQRTFAPNRTWGNFTGDPEIDQILVMFMRPPQLGAA